MFDNVKTGKDDGDDTSAAGLLFFNSGIILKGSLGFGMKVILFSIYYCRLHLSVMLGLHRSITPLDLKWRWNHWNNIYYRRHKRYRAS